MNSIRFITLASLGTAIACGLGALPFIWKKNIDKKWIGYANALASSMMIAASFDLIYQWLFLNPGSHTQAAMVIGGVVIWLLFILITHRLTEKYEHEKKQSHVVKSWSRALLLLIVMTMHSWAEGMAMWVARGAWHALWVFVLIVMALQNIPEWLAISLQMVPNGTPWWKAALRSIGTSLPQPLFAPIAFYFVESFQPLVPRGLGFAAWCMLWMCFGEITAESYEGTDPAWVGVIATTSIILMLCLQVLIA